jgi:ribosome biogenesis GTPase A
MRHSEVFFNILATSFVDFCKFVSQVGGLHMYIYLQPQTFHFEQVLQYHVIEKKNSLNTKITNFSEHRSMQIAPNGKEKFSRATIHPYAHVH